jgi:hypothetical protein
MASDLILHNPKFESKLASYNEIAALPLPVALGRHHKPVPHARLIDGLRQEIAIRGYAIEREQFALGAKGNALFGIINLQGTNTQRALALGFRNAVDTSMAIRAVAGVSVFVCDNLALSGSEFAIQRKNTTGLDLADAIARGFDKFLQHATAYDLEIARLQAKQIRDVVAKQIIYDAFAAGVVPSRLFDDVDEFYFRPTQANTPETLERTLWGLHNAFTRAMRDLTPVRRFGATVALGRLFSQATGEIVDGEVVAVQPEPLLAV